MIKAILELLSSTNFWSDVILKLFIFGIFLFIFQKYFEHRLKPLTAEETLKRQNFLNAKKDVYYEAIELVNREFAHIDFKDLAGNLLNSFERNRGAKRPNEFEINSIFSKLCVYSDNKKIPLTFKRFFLKKPEDRPIGILEEFINLIRHDMGYGKEILTTKSNEYEYISIGLGDTN